MAEWSFLTNHARALLCIAHDPGVRLRDIATTVGITERTAYGLIIDLTKAGYVVKEKDGRRNRYHIQEHLPVAGDDRARNGPSARCSTCSSTPNLAERREVALGLPRSRHRLPGPSLTLKPKGVRSRGCTMPVTRRGPLTCRAGLGWLGERCSGPW